ncbi:hypothetical protein [Endozoicomonas arenosclerae]|uniref:hypothetical protein n=1 Tax=Endozoicomonas arenosclerae TaxID=1633495 RepID=UPI00078392EF|nr:hypothetical protein [Endozoicomonas arenosclerae]
MTKLAMSLVVFVKQSVPGILLLFIVTIISPVADALTISISSSRGEVIISDRFDVVVLNYYYLLVPYGKDEAPFKLSSLDLNDHRFMFSDTEEVTFSIVGEELQWHVPGLGKRMANLFASGWQTVIYDDRFTGFCPSRAFYYLASDYGQGRLSFRILSADLKLHLSKMKSGHLVGLGQSSSDGENFQFHLWMIYLAGNLYLVLFPGMETFYVMDKVELDKYAEAFMKKGYQYNLISFIGLASSCEGCELSGHRLQNQKKYLLDRKSLMFKFGTDEMLSGYFNHPSAYTAPSGSYIK